MLKICNSSVEFCNKVKIMDAGEVVLRELKRIDFSFFTIMVEIHLKAELLKSL